MSSGVTSVDEYPLRELREYVAGRLDVEHSDASPAALIADDEIRALAFFMEDVYDPSRHEDLPPDFWETVYGKRLLREGVTERAAKAFNESKKELAGSITGLPNYESDISGLHTTNRLEDWLIGGNEMSIIYLAGTQGAGKTDFSLSMLQVVDRCFERAKQVEGVNPSDVPTPEFATNFSIQTPSGVDHRVINDYGSLSEWLTEGSSDEQKWFVFDEASTELTAQSSSNAQKVVEKMNELVKKGRKFGLSGLVVIGHDSKDVAPLFRMLADYVEKTGTKTASFYASVRDRDGEGHLFDLSGIPQSEWKYDTDDTASWDWSDGSGSSSGSGGYTEAELRELRDERIQRLYERVDGITQPDLADAFDVSTATVSRAVSDD